MSALSDIFKDNGQQASKVQEPSTVNPPQDNQNFFQKAWGSLFGATKTPPPPPPPAPAVKTGPLTDIFKPTTQTTQETSLSEIFKPKTTETAPSPYFSTTTPSGASVGFSDIKDTSGKPLFAYRNPGDTATTTDKTRVATTFDPFKPQKMDSTTFYNPRDPNVTKLRNVMGASYSDQLDHKISLELSGSNAKENLQLEKTVSGTKTATDPLENSLARDVASGKISLADAQIKLANAKGIDAPWVPPEYRNDKKNFWDQFKQYISESAQQFKDIPVKGTKPSPLSSIFKDYGTNSIANDPVDYFTKLATSVKNQIENGQYIQPKSKLADVVSSGLKAKEQIQEKTKTPIADFMANMNRYAEGVTQSLSPVTGNTQRNFGDIFNMLPAIVRTFTDPALDLAEVKLNKSLSYKLPAFNNENITTQGARAYYDEQVKNGVDPDTAFASTALKVVGDMTILVPLFKNMAKFGLIKMAPDKLLEQTIFDTTQVKKFIATGEPMPEPLQNAFKALPNDTKASVVRGLVTQITGNKPSLLGKILGISEEEAKILSAQVNATKAAAPEDALRLPGYKSIYPEKKGGLQAQPVERVGGAEGEKGITKTAPVFEGFKDLTTTTLDALKGRSTVSKQFISDLTNKPELKQQERDIIRNILNEYPDKSNIPVQEFADKVKAELLPLTRNSGEPINVDDAMKQIKEAERQGDWNTAERLTLQMEKSDLSHGTKYENISLPEEQRGSIKNYRENIYESPIMTSAGGTHFPGATKNYFGHTRVEDMADDATRRVIEVQSDLYQKGRLESETTAGIGLDMSTKEGKQYKKISEEIKKVLNDDSLSLAEKAKQKRALEIKQNKVYELGRKPAIEARTKQIAKLQQYSNPTAHFRMVREEIAQAAKDGKTKLQFPTGETAMKIEGLGESSLWTTPENREIRLQSDELKVGKLIEEDRGGRGLQNLQWVVTEVLGNGKFKAVPSHSIFPNETGYLSKELGYTEAPNKKGYVYKKGDAETFDISGKVDTSNPIYRFYEKDLGRYLTSKYGAKLVTDKQGVKWYEVDIKPELAKKPVLAFNKDSSNINTYDKLNRTEKAGSERRSASGSEVSEGVSGGGAKDDGRVPSGNSTSDALLHSPDNTGRVGESSNKLPRLEELKVKTDSLLNQDLFLQGKISKADFVNKSIENAKKLGLPKESTDRLESSLSGMPTPLLQGFGGVEYIDKNYPDIKAVFNLNGAGNWSLTINPQFYTDKAYKTGNIIHHEIDGHATYAFSDETFKTDINTSVDKIINGKNSEAVLKELFANKKGYHVPTIFSYYQDEVRLVYDSVRKMLDKANADKVFETLGYTDKLGDFIVHSETSAIPYFEKTKGIWANVEKEIKKSYSELWSDKAWDRIQYERSYSQLRNELLARYTEKYDSISQETKNAFVGTKIHETAVLARHDQTSLFKNTHPRNVNLSIRSEDINKKKGITSDPRETLKNIEERVGVKPVKRVLTTEERTALTKDINDLKAEIRYATPETRREIIKEMSKLRDRIHQSDLINYKIKEKASGEAKSASEYIKQKGLNPDSVIIIDDKKFIVENTAGQESLLKDIPIKDFKNPKFETLNQDSYLPGKKIKDPIEAEKLPNGNYRITDGANRFTQAIANGDKTIPTIVHEQEVPVASQIGDNKTYFTVNRVERDAIEKGMRELKKVEAKSALEEKLKIKLPQSLQNKAVEMAIRKEALDANPMKSLMKFMARRGEFKGRLPEVTGKPGKGTFARVGDRYISEATGIEDSEEARAAFEKYVEDRKKFEQDMGKFVKEKQAFLKESRAKRDEIIANQKIGKMHERTERHISQILGDEATRKARIERLKQKEAEKQAALKKLQEDQARYSRQVEAAHLAEAQKKSLIAKFKNILAPIEYTDATTKRIYLDWETAKLKAKEAGNVMEDKYKNMPNNDYIELLEYEAGKKTPWIFEAFEDLYTEAKRADVNFRHKENYIPHVYNEKPEYIKKAVEKYMLDQGVPKDQIEVFDKTDKIPEAMALKIKTHPFFEKIRTFPDYETATKYGLTARFQTPSEHIAFYKEELGKIIANRKMIDSLIKEGKVLDAFDAPDTWIEVKLPGRLRRTYYAPKNLADSLNGQFRDEDNLTFGQEVFKRLSNISKTIQEIKLSAGIPGTNINFFSIGQAIKSLTVGLGEIAKGNVSGAMTSVRAAQTFIRANFNKQSIAWLKENKKYIDMLADQNVPMMSRVDDYTKNRTLWRNLLTAKNIKEVKQGFKDYGSSLKNAKGFKEFVKNAVTIRDNKAFGVAKDLFDKSFNEKTFNSMMPQMQIQVFKDIYEGAISKGMPEQTAKEFAASTVKAEFGVINDLGRTKNVKEVFSSVFFAPKFREGIVNVFANAGKGWTNEFKNPAFGRSRSLVIGAIISYIVYNYINSKLNDGDNMWDNAPGHEFDLKIPLPNGKIVYTPFMPSVLSFIRNMGSSLLNFAQGRNDVALQKAGTLFSMPVAMASQVIANKDFFGNPIYKVTDDATTKVKKAAEYMGLGVIHPYFSELYKYFNDKQDIYATISNMTELPLKFSTAEKEAVSKAYEAKQAKYEATARAKGDLQPTYDRIQELIANGQSAEAKKIFDSLTKEEHDIYQKIKVSAKTKATLDLKNQMRPVYTNIQSLIKKGKESDAKAIYDALSPQEKKAYQLVKKEMGS